jgi:nucleoside-diphosphate-sugar epimerase
MLEELQKTVFVTGATGFIGSSTVKQLHGANFRVVALLRSLNKRALIAPYVDEFIEGDLQSKAALVRGITQADVVLHLASGLHRPWDHRVHQINIDGTRQLAQLCARSDRPPHLIIVSSLAARGPTRKSGVTAPISAYGKAKKAAEDAAISAYHPDHISIVRPPMVFGPGDEATKPIFDAIKFGFVPISRSPSARFSMIDVRDLATGLLKLCQHGCLKAANPIYFAYKAQLKMEEIAGLVAQHHGLTYRKFHCPNWIIWTVSVFSELFARLTRRSATLNRDKYLEMTNGPWTCDPAHAESHLDWRPNSTLAVRLAEVFETYFPDNT